jgi:hypothetical protein
MDYLYRHFRKTKLGIFKTEQLFSSLLYFVFTLLCFINKKLIITYIFPNALGRDGKSPVIILYPKI